MKITNIKTVNHCYHKLTGMEFFHVHYTSGRMRTFHSWGELPETVKAFLRSHYDIIDSNTEYSTIYSYKAANIIK